MRIRSHYDAPPARRLLPALLALVYAGVLTGGLAVHMVEEGDELRTLAAEAAERIPGEPLPFHDGVPDDLDCMLCQVTASPPEAGPQGPSLPLPTPVAAEAHPGGEPAGDPPSSTRQARAPPLA